jgi:PAS domain-containing protein
LELTNNVEAGEHDLAARFVNDFFAAGSADKKRQDRNLDITALSVVGPLDPPPVTEFSQWIDAALANGSFETALSALGLRVWRRPLEPAELARLAALSPSTAPPRERARSALVGLLASPNFLYRIETTTPGAALSGFELATRLSYFLWDSAPDRRLFKLAASNELNDPKILAAEIQRMLVDARSRSLVEEFGAQWLGWRALERATPDLSTFPSADEALLSSMRQESEAFFEAMLRENRPLDEFLDADFTFVDERLAKLYGIEGVIGEGVRRVHLSDRDRGGLLGQAAILTATSNPTRTSPVKRGKWVLETLLGSSVPPPPPGVGALSEAIPGVKPKSVREQLDLHRTKQDCASCHSKLDPIGFALEGFDAIGQRRMFDGENPVDCRGKLDDGTEVNGVLELKQYLQAHGTFPQSMARALFLYALGRAPSRIEERDLAKCVDELPADQKTISSLIEIICRQPAFSHAGVP